MWSISSWKTEKRYHAEKNSTIIKQNRKIGGGTRPNIMCVSSSLYTCIRENEIQAFVSVIPIWIEASIYSVIAPGTPIALRHNYNQK